MHQYPADGVMAKAPALVLAAVDAFCHAYQMRCDALVGELCRVLDKKDSTSTRIIPRTWRGKMAAKDLVFLNAIIREKSISSFRVCPILARKRYALAHAVTHLPQDVSKTTT